MASSRPACSSSKSSCFQWYVLLNLLWNFSPVLWSLLILSLYLANFMVLPGYDNAGQRHSQQKYPSTQTSSRTQTGSSSGSGSGSASAAIQARTKNGPAKKAPAPPAPVMRNPGPPPVSSAKPTYQYGPEGDGVSDSDDDHYYD